MSDLNLKLLAKVPNLDAQTAAYCRGPQTPKNPAGAREGRFPYFAEGYVDLSIPRDSAYTDDIHVATTAFGIADEKGRIVRGDIPSLKAAEKAIAGASINLDVQIDLPEAAAKA